jgi:hypothetical protein
MEQHHSPRSVGGFAQQIAARAGTVFDEARETPQASLAGFFDLTHVLDGSLRCG